MKIMGLHFFICVQLIFNCLCKRLTASGVAKVAIRSVNYGYSDEFRAGKSLQTGVRNYPTTLSQLYHPPATNIMQGIQQPASHHFPANNHPLNRPVHEAYRSPTLNGLPQHYNRYPYSIPQNFNFNPYKIVQHAQIPHNQGLTKVQVPNLLQSQIQNQPIRWSQRLH
ncbi:uncharacterized protein LOC136025206 isoform X2 [Artemia franciscana]|uniref:uncharacterized protein LOC136025206 isoform X2 n=1 Tax=Artemia franciscana TaxID=6661 RepID=UPI0032D9DCB3